MPAYAITRKGTPVSDVKFVLNSESASPAAEASFLRSGIVVMSVGTLGNFTADVTSGDIIQSSCDANKTKTVIQILRGGIAIFTQVVSGGCVPVIVECPAPPTPPEPTVCPTCPTPEPCPPPTVCPTCAEPLPCPPPPVCPTCAEPIPCPEPTPCPIPPPPEKCECQQPKINWLVVGGIVAVVIAVPSLIYLGSRRRK